MRIEAHNAFANPINAEVTRVVVYDDHDQPVGLFVSQGPGLVLASTVKDGYRFQKALRDYGVATARVTVTQVDLSNLPTFEADHG